ncbi:MAG: hypothetical protein J6U89_08120 [Bacteroidaceae bacterium]|nr:hypothetical protein [Bacteroidaceae bacterium]
MRRNRNASLPYNVRCNRQCARKAVRGWEKVAARSEGFAFVAILYTGAVGNKCGLS